MSASPANGFPRPSPRILFALLVVAALLVAREPYRGVRHDAILYLAQALSHLDARWTAHDMFFVGGSQDRYSVFATLLSRVLPSAGIGPSEIAALLVGWVCFVAALALLTRELPWRLRWLGIAAVLAASHYYGAQRIFGYFEPFVTGRTWSEPLTLLSLAAWMFGRRRVAGVLLLAGALCHPLPAIPALAIVFAWLVAEDRRWAWLLTALVPMVGLAFAGVAPFDGLLQVYDAAWLHATQFANNAVYLLNWEPADLLPAALQLALVYTFSRLHPETSLARLARAAVFAVPALCVVSLVGADILHDVLITQLQLWRCLWIVAVLAMLALPSVLAALWVRGANGRVAAVALLVAVFTADTWLSTAWAMAAWASLALYLCIRDTPLKPFVSRLAIVSTWLVGLLMSALQAFNVLSQLQMHEQGTTVADPWSVPFTLPLLTLPLVWLAMAGWERGGAARIAAACGAAAVLLVSLWHWDQRSDWSRYIEASRPGTHPFAALVPPDKQVFWYEDVLAEWVLLERPSFLSHNQMSGLLFSRPSAMAAIQRNALLNELSKRHGDCATMEFLGAPTARVLECRVPRDVLVQICRGPGPRADYLVAPVDLGAGAIARWRFDPPSGRPSVTYVLHDCRAFR